MNNLRQIRRAKDITQHQLADAIGSAKSYICELEKGKVKSPSLYKAYAISEVLGESIYEIFPMGNK